jgi:hypothetical protein
VNYQLVPLASSGPQTFLCAGCGVKVTQARENGVRVGDWLNGEVWADLDGPAFKYHCWWCKRAEVKRRTT